MTTTAALSISPDADVTTVIERFDVAAADQDRALTRAAAHVDGTWCASPEFVGATLLRGRDHGGIVAYSQWRGGAGDHGLGGVAGIGQPVDARAFSVAFTRPGSPMMLSRETTPLVHFGVFTMPADRQDTLLEAARTNAPRSLDVTPGLVSIAFHRSDDGTAVINLGTWTTFDEFARLLATPGFRDGDVYWAGIADFAPDFFSVELVRAIGSGAPDEDVVPDAAGP